MLPCSLWSKMHCESNAEGNLRGRKRCLNVMEQIHAKPSQRRLRRPRPSSNPLVLYAS